MGNLFLESDAMISECGQYRYWLTRRWSRHKDLMCWIMLNPSTADASVDDPTIRRCMDFAQRWGHGGIEVVNLFALRSTDPEQLRRHYPISPELVQTNNTYIQTAAHHRCVIAAWGVHGCLHGRDREVMDLLKWELVKCLGLTKDGHPKHPLYVPANTIPVPFTLGKHQ